MTGNVEQELRLANLMRAAQGGDSNAYAELLRSLAPLIRKTVRQRFRFMQALDIEDLTQEILLSLHTARRTYDPTRSFLPWFMAIARNRMADSARRNARRSVHEVSSERAPEAFCPEGQNISAWGYGDVEALEQAMTTLPFGQRQAIELMKLKEMSLKEASVATGMSIGALKVSTHRGMSALRKALGTGGRG
jgi:RNA polymerase sigma-70 factor (ECF subfamily)